MNGKEMKFAVLWIKLIFSVVFMLGGLAMVVWWMFGMSFTDFWAQVLLLFIAISVGLIGAILAFRTQVIVTR